MIIFPSRWSRAQRGIAAGLVGTLVAATVAAFALDSPGYAQTDVDLSTSTVWTTNNTDGVVGRVNLQVEQLNSSFKSDPNFDVLQGHGRIYTVDRSGNLLKTVNDATVTTGAALGLPKGAGVGYGGGVLSIVDPATGKLWAGTADALAGLDPAVTPPLLVTAAHAVTTVSLTGTSFTVAAGSNKLWSLAFGTDGVLAGGSTDKTGRVVPPPPTTLPGAALSATPPGAALSATPPGVAGSLSITAVGDVPVVLDAGAGQLVIGTHRIAVADAADAVLQQPGPAADAVLVETKSALLQYPLNGDAPKTLYSNGNGQAVAPVLLDGCVWAAWNGPSTVEALACDGNTARSVTLPGTGARDPVFRVNDHAIVLNDRISGTIWALDKNMTVTVIDNWDQVKPEDQSQKATNSDGSKTQSSEIAASRADCTKQGPARSTAADAKFEVRAGRSTVLPILDDVTAGDCAAVIVSGVSALPAAAGSVDIVNAGQAVQVTVPPGASGPLPTLTYTIDDGINPAVQASLSISVAPASQVGDVKKQRDSSTVVEINGSIGYDVLPDYYSTTGDDLYLTGATATTAGDSVDYAPGGRITFHDKGSSGTGNHEVLFTITDGRVVRSGKLTVDVKPDGSAQPIASAVVARSLPGVPVTVKPLSSVLSPGLDPLQLTAVSIKGAAGGATASLSSADDSVVLQSATAGTYYFTYKVVAGQGRSTGVLRFDVTAPPARPGPPLATADVVYLPEGDSVRVDPTANDVDPNDAGLALAQVGPDSTGTLTVTTTRMQTLQIAARGILSGTAVMSYVVSNGIGSATGQIRVIPVPALQDPPTPTAGPISLTVRAGDALTLPMARFATDPRGESLTPSIVSSAAAVPGVLFSNATEIRYLAPVTPPSAPVKFSYSVRNTSGQTSAAATVTLTITPRDPSGDSAPNTPTTVIGRVLAGRSTTVELPLDGIDPDGDWVDATKVNGTARGLGTATVTGLSSLTYNALAKPGVDTITYTVADPYGKQTTGTVTMIVVATPNVVQPPVAPNLVASVRPGKAVAVRPLESGVTGENVRLATPAVDQVAGWQAVGDGDALVIGAAGKSSGVAAFTYHVIDDRGLTASGVITVTISPTAPLVPPVAQDVIVTSAMVKDKLNATVDVGGSIQNNTGKANELTVAATAGGPAVMIAPHAFRIPLTANRQVLAYTATDTQAQVATAFIVVPAKSALVLLPPPPPTPQQKTPPPDQPPVPRQAVPTITVAAGATANGRIADYVDVPAGRTAQIPAGSALSATQGTGRRLDAGTFSYTADKNGNGPDVLTVRASDGSSAAVAVSVPISIIPTTPVLNGTTLDVEVGTSGTINLASLVSPANYPDMGALKFMATSAVSGFTASRNGTTLTVAVSNSVKKGSSAQVPISVTDTRGATVTAAVTVTATGTTKPLPTVGDQSQVGRPGVATSFPVLNGSSDPYGTGLTLLPAPKVLQGRGSATISGSNVLITPAAGQIGNVVVQFTVADGTKDPSRQVSGQLTLTVKDKPHAPGQPTPVPNSATASSVTLTWDWQPSWANGGTITPFVVSAPGIPDTTCQNSNCQIGNLTPGRSYAFTVSVSNEDGTSRSTPSAPITPDASPPAPAAPSVTLTADRQLTVSWSIGKDDRSYSPISTATLTEVVNGVDGTAGRVAVSGPGRQAFDGLDITATYSFYLTVTNSKGTVRSQASSPQHPNTTPGPPTGVKLAFDPDPRAVTVSWAPPAGSAQRPAPVGYTVTYASNGSTMTVSASGDATSVAIPGPVDGSTYTVDKIVATNKYGNGDPSGGSGNTVTPFTRPAAVTGVGATATGADSSVRLDNVQGGRSSGRQGADSYSTDGNSWKGFNPGDVVTTDSNGSPLANGTQYTFRVRVCYPPEDPYSNAQLCGDPGSGQATPYGPVGTPANVRQTDQSSTQIRFNWSPPADNGRGPITTSYSVDGGPMTAFGQGDATVVVGAWTCGTSHTISVQASDSAGHSGPASGTVTGSTSGCPPPGAPTNLRQTDNSQTQIRFNWSPPGDNGKSPITTQYSVDGGGYTDYGPGDATVVVGNWGCATSHTISVHATDSTGQVGPAASVSGSTQACPPPPPVTSIQAYVYGDANNHNGGGPGSQTCVSQNTHVCKYIGVYLNNFPANSRQPCTFQTGHNATITTDGAGNADGRPGWYSGYQSATVTCGAYSSTVTW